MENDRKTDTVFYIAGWCIVLLAAACLAAMHLCHLPLMRYTKPCLLHTWTGYYCPGCGGTRAVYALFSGKLFLSIRYHPLVPYTAAVGGWFMISQTMERLSRGRLKIGMHMRERWLWLALAIVTVNFVIKNLLLAVWNVDLLI